MKFVTSLLLLVAQQAVASSTDAKQHNVRNRDLRVSKEDITASCKTNTPLPFGKSSCKNKCLTGSECEWNADTSKYHCVCGEGYEGLGHCTDEYDSACRDINECQLAALAPDMEAAADCSTTDTEWLCVNEDGGFSCVDPCLSIMTVLDPTYLDACIATTAAMTEKTICNVMDFMDIAADFETVFEVDACTEGCVMGGDSMYGHSCCDPCSGWRPDSTTCECMEDHPDGGPVIPGEEIPKDDGSDPNCSDCLPKVGSCSPGGWDGCKCICNDCLNITKIFDAGTYDTQCETTPETFCDIMNFMEANDFETVFRSTACAKDETCIPNEEYVCHDCATEFPDCTEVLGPIENVNCCYYEGHHWNFETCGCEQDMM